MIQNMFTIFDEKAQAYLPPFFMPTDGMAKRTFSECIGSTDHQFGKHPHDYTLFKLGSFDDNTSHLQLSKAPQSLGNGLEYVQSANSKNSQDTPNEKTIGDEPPIQSSPQSGNSA